MADAERQKAVLEIRIEEAVKQVNLCEQPTETQKDDATWVVKPGLAEKDAISLMKPKDTETFARHDNDDKPAKGVRSVRCPSFNTPSISITSNRIQDWRRIVFS